MFDLIQPYWLDVFVLFSAAAALMIIWTMVLITRCTFLNINDPPIMRQARRFALTLIAFGLLYIARDHWLYRAIPSFAEVLLVIGMDLYLGLAIYSTYARERKTTEARSDVMRGDRRRTMIHNGWQR